MSSRADYGIDSPAIVGGLAILACIAFGAALSLRLWRAYPVVELGLFVAGAYFFLGGCGMIWYSKVGKLRIRNQILQHIAWRGDEFALDVGCGRGLLLVGAARQLTSGKAIGVDRWVPGTLTGPKPLLRMRERKEYWLEWKYSTVMCANCLLQTPHFTSCSPISYCMN